MYNTYVEAKKFSKEKHVEINEYLADFEKNISDWTKHPKTAAPHIPTIFQFFRKEAMKGA